MNQIGAARALGIAILGISYNNALREEIRRNCAVTELAKAKVSNLRAWLTIAMFAKAMW